MKEWKLEPADEESHWRREYRSRPYFREGLQFDDYQPAYQYGWECATKPDFVGRHFDEVESEIATNWRPGPNGPEWTEIRGPARDAYERVHERMMEKAKE